jgi:hypothetical protein
MNSYTQIPNAVFQGMASGEISRDEFDVLAACYFWADRQGWVIRSYSAARLCRFLGLDASEGNVRRFERAARNLLDRKIIRRDYYRGRERTYSLWVPSPARFRRVGTADENDSLWQANVGVLVGHNVGLQTNGTPSETVGYSAMETDNVGVHVGEKAYPLSIKDQGSAKIAPEIDPLPPPGIPPLPSPPGMRSNGAGLEKATAAARRKTLNADQCELLNEAALQYVGFTNWLYDFVPDLKATASLLRDFTPQELWCAQLEKFVPGGKQSTRIMAHFFAQGARSIIEAARLNGTSQSVPKFEISIVKGRWKDFPCKWRIVRDAYEKVFGVTE